VVGVEPKDALVRCGSMGPIWDQRNDESRSPCHLLEAPQLLVRCYFYENKYKNIYKKAGKYHCPYNPLLLVINLLHIESNQNTA
jgi:hypothetical protein